MSSPTVKQLLYLQSSILLALHTHCGLSQKEVSNILKRVDLLGYIEKNYGIYHIEGIYSILDDIKRYLSEYNINIKVEEMPG